MNQGIALLACFAAASVFAQSFEVASIHQCAPGTRENPGLHNGTADFSEPGGRLNASATNISYLIEWAYGIQPAQHSSGPAWMGTECYNLAAQSSPDATPAEIKQATRALLEDRFQLKLHHEKRSLPAVIVTQGKSSPKLFPPKDGETHGFTFKTEMGPDQKMAAIHVAFTRFTLGQINDVFARLLSRVLVDETGLPGEFDFTLTLTPDPSRPNLLDPGLLVTALREDLGLKLDSRDAEVDFLVIDSIQRPSAN